VVTATRPGEEGRRRYEALDSLRGLCACGVVLYHIHTTGFVTNLPVFRQGWLFVDFFFVLSGFVIAASYGEALRAGFSLRAYMILRLGRIYPLHLFMLLAFLALELGLLVSGLRGPTGRGPFAGTRTLPLLLDNLLLVQIFVPDGSQSWNAPSWSIAAEMWTYALTAIGLAAMKRRFRLALAAIVVAAPPILLVYGNHGLGSSDLALVRCLFGFSIGMLAFDLRTRLRIGPGLSRRAATAIELAAIAACLAAMSVPGRGPLLILCPFLFAVTILALAGEKGAASDLLTRAPMRRLGALSYSIYMTQALVIILFIRALGFAGARLNAPLLAGGSVNGHPVEVIVGAAPDLLAFLCLALILLAASFTWRYVELPFRAASRRLAERIAHRPLDAAERVAPTI
jgi:peptidoglycan/LPS O-acetylase OafA/YrhL